MLAEHLADHYQEYGNGQGKVRMWHLGNRIGVFESTGKINADHVRRVVKFHQRHIELFPRPWYSFGNWMNLDGYTPDTRRVLTDWQVEAKYEELHVAHRSKLLAMSISVANALLQNTVKVVSTESALEEILQGVRERHSL